MLGRLKTLFRINSCSPCTRCRQGKRGDRPRASRRACKPAYEACNRSATTHNRSTTGKRFSFSVAIRNSFTAGVQIRESAEAKLEADDASFTPRRRLRLVRQEDPQKELEKLAFGQCLLAGLRGGQVFEDRHDNNTARNSRECFERARRNIGHRPKPSVTNYRSARSSWACSGPFDKKCIFLQSISTRRSYGSDTVIF